MPDHSKIILTDSLELILFIASANSGATLTTSILSILASSDNGIVSVITNFSSSEVWILSNAGPERTPWVAQP